MEAHQLERSVTIGLGAQNAATVGGGCYRRIYCRTAFASAGIAEYDIVNL